MKFKSNKKLFLIFGLAFILRVALSFTAYHGDLNNNISWGELALERGFNEFYGSSDAREWPYSAPNQPPLYLIVFTITIFIYQKLTSMFFFLNDSIRIFPSGFIWFWERWGLQFTAKLPSILADMGIGILIYKITKERSTKKNAIILSAIWLFNPISWYNSSVWGQTDSIVNFLGLLGIHYLFRQKLEVAMVFITLAVLFKSSLIIFLPLLLIFIIKQNHSMVSFLRSTFYSLITLVAISIWFHPSINFPIWLVNIYHERILPGEIGSATAGAFNFWWLIARDVMSDHAMYMGISLRTIGFSVTFLIVSILIFAFIKKTSKTSLFISLCLISITSFMFLTRMHGRYLYPFFPIATLLLFDFKKIRLPYIVLSLTFLLNMYDRFWGISVPSLEAIMRSTEINTYLAAINLTTFLLLFYFSFKDHYLVKSNK